MKSKKKIVKFEVPVCELGIVKFEKKEVMKDE